MARLSLKTLQRNRLTLATTMISLALTNTRCSEPKKTQTNAPAPATAQPYNPYYNQDQSALAEAERLRREQEERNRGECTTTNCSKVTFTYTIAQGEDPNSRGSLSGASDTSVTWSLTPVPDIALGNREFKFNVKGAPSDARTVVNPREIRIIFNSSKIDNGVLEILARDMGYCQIERETDKNIDCNNFDTARSRDQASSVSYRIYDKEDTPLTEEERAIRERKRLIALEEKRRLGDAIGCIGTQGSEALSVDRKIGDLVGTIAGVIAGGSGRGCSSRQYYDQTYRSYGTGYDRDRTYYDTPETNRQYLENGYRSDGL